MIVEPATSEPGKAIRGTAVDCPLLEGTDLNGARRAAGPRPPGRAGRGPGIAAHGMQAVWRPFQGRLVAWVELQDS